MEKTQEKSNFNSFAMSLLLPRLVVIFVYQDECIYSAEKGLKIEIRELVCNNTKSAHVLYVLPT